MYESNEPSDDDDRLSEYRPSCPPSPDMQHEKRRTRSMPGRQDEYAVCQERAAKFNKKHTKEERVRLAEAGALLPISWRSQVKSNKRPAKATKQLEEPESDGHPDSESTADADAEAIEPFEDFESAVDAPPVPFQQQQSMFPFISGPPVLGKTEAAFLDDLDINDNNRLQIENEQLLAS
jgi:hypothetical protein